MMSNLHSILPAPINHLLAQEPWARSRLAAHAGKVARLDAGVLAVTWQVGPDGMLLNAAPDAAHDVVIRIKLSDLPLILQNRERAASYVRIEGDADFANAISQLSQSLKWEAEHDLSRWIGDIAANRLVGGVKSALATARSTGQALTANVAEYFIEENPMLTRAQAVAELGRDVTKLRDDVERLEKRLSKLERT